MKRISIGPSIRKRDLPMKNASIRNENKMKAFAKELGYQIPLELKKPVKFRGRPKEKINIPKRYAARLTKKGEEKYIIIASTEDIKAMKRVAKKKGIKIKEAYAEAISNYLQMANQSANHAK